MHKSTQRIADIWQPYAKNRGNKENCDKTAGKNEKRMKSRKKIAA